ncbi:XRE family transcriptional regulator [Micromonospora craterilacus]|uniref:XRE family transcriptional regulator n=1 Tax=Micromonospora craterilacus TaxID=1655439 RepID=A0A2W2ECI9_9ACTN|nr:helix-turn-helix transcriptional regulator [Micromonospora craterilacus]PZG14745.1 XRE family transcriptional regulator [Micromonospora craterilacus]
MTGSRLATQIATALRRERERQQLTQRALADLAGVGQATLANLEKGQRLPSIRLVERVFEALERQLSVVVEPLDAHLDARLADLAARPLADRVDDLNLDRLLDRLGDLPYLLTGSTAAILQGAPVPADGCEIAVRWRDSVAFTAWLNSAYAQRWSERWGEYGGLRVEPEEPGAHRWLTRFGEVRATMCDELPEPIEVRHGERAYRVVPLVEVVLADPRAAGLLRRYQSRSTA